MNTLVTFTFQMTLILLGAFVADAAPRPSASIIGYREAKLETTVEKIEDEHIIPIRKSEDELRTPIIEKRQTELRTLIEKIKLRTPLAKREAEAIPPIGSCGC